MVRRMKKSSPKQTGPHSQVGQEKEQKRNGREGISGGSVGVMETLRFTRPGSKKEGDLREKRN